MNYKFQSLKQVLDVFAKDEKLWATEIARRLWKSRAIVHKYLKTLVAQWKLQKIWNPPHVKYYKTYTDEEENSKISIQDDVIISFQEKKILDDIFLKFSPTGDVLKWFEGFKIWCQQRGFDVSQKAKSYIQIDNYIKSLQDSCWLISATEIFWKQFEQVYLDNIYYTDQYNRMDFGRWKLAEVTFYAKSSQNKELINQSINEVSYRLKCIVKKNNYDAIAIVPWSIDRKTQLLKILQKELISLWLPFVNIIKYYPSWVSIPQKSLKTRQQRIQNAQKTIFVDDNYIESYNKILLIDDFVGSGSTLNETAKKLKQEWIKIVDGFVFVGNLNLSYDIISEI